MRHYPFILPVTALCSAEAVRSTMNLQLLQAIFQEYDPSINWTSFKFIEITTSNAPSLLSPWPPSQRWLKLDVFEVVAYAIGTFKDRIYTTLLFP